MSEGEFKNGQQVKAIFFEDGGGFSLSSNSVEKIEVVMEHGQMSLVPWFAVYKDGKIDTKWNGALLSGVEVQDE